MKYSSMQSRQIATFAWSKNRRIINMLALLLDDHLKEGACKKYSSRCAGQGIAELYARGLSLCSHRSSAAKTMGRSVWLPAGIAAAKPPNCRGFSERDLYGRTGGKILPVCIRHSENHLSEINWQGLQKCSPCFCIGYRLIRYGSVDRKGAVAAVRY